MGLQYLNLKGLLGTSALWRRKVGHDFPAQDMRPRPPLLGIANQRTGETTASGALTSCQPVCGPLPPVPTCRPSHTNNSGRGQEALCAVRRERGARLRLTHGVSYRRRCPRINHVALHLRGCRNKWAMDTIRQILFGTWPIVFTCVASSIVERVVP